MSYGQLGYERQKLMIKIFREDDMVLKVEAKDISTPEEHVYKLKVLEVIQQSKVYLGPKVGEVFEVSRIKNHNFFYNGMWSLADS